MTGKGVLKELFEKQHYKTATVWFLDSSSNKLATVIESTNNETKNNQIKQNEKRITVPKAFLHDGSIYMLALKCAVRYNLSLVTPN